jgi:hypothetical protein
VFGAIIGCHDAIDHSLGLSLASLQLGGSPATPTAAPSAATVLNGPELKGPESTANISTTSTTDYYHTATSAAGGTMRTETVAEREARTEAALMAAAAVAVALTDAQAEAETGLRLESGNTVSNANAAHATSAADNETVSTGSGSVRVVRRTSFSSLKFDKPSSPPSSPRSFRRRQKKVPYHIYSPL